MQPKFKKGDKIRCISQSMAKGIEVGGIYTVLNPMYHDYGYDISIEVEGLDEVSPYQSRFELVEETNKPKFNVGDMVETPLGLFEVLDSYENSFFCYKEGFNGHSGVGYFGDKYVRTKYKDQCRWFDVSELKLVETKEQPKINYREMSPDTLVKVKVGSYESNVCLGDLVHATALLGVTNGYYGARLWEFLKNAIGEDGFEEDLETSIEFIEKQRQTLNYFFTPARNKQKQKEALKKDIETQKHILETQQALLKDLEVKYNSL